MKEKLRLGICISNENIPLWIFRTIEKIVNSEFSEIKLLIIIKEDQTIQENKSNSFVYSIHEKLDHFLVRKRFDYDKVVGITGLLDGVQKIIFNAVNTEALTGNKGEYIENKILQFNLDIILNFDLSCTCNFSNKLTKYGTWSYNLGDSNKREFSNGYWELIKKTGIEATVKFLNGPYEKNIIIFRTWLANYSNSLYLNRNQFFGLASLVIPRLLKGLWSNGPGYIDKQIGKYQKETEVINNVLNKSPSSLEALKNLLIISGNIFHNKITYANENNWFLLYKISSKPDLFPENLGTFKVLMPPKDRFWADPFVVSKENKFYIFVEELFFKTNKGHIAVLELDNEGKLLKTDQVLERPYHLSYPFVFEWDNTYYMIPESQKNKTIELYRCTHFPDKWEFQMNLIGNIAASDTTLFYHKNKWWLFTVINESLCSPNYFELFLFYSNNFPSSEWTPHPENPIVTDMSTARPAGKIFTYDNKVFRPSQDCSGIYGKAINLNQIIAFSETEYDEILITKVEADWEPKLKGTHTLNSDRNIMIIDAYKFRKRL